jgi:peptidoglycan/LPS O-acetylase OafA/YrhL
MVRRIVVLRLDAIAFGILAIWAVRTYPSHIKRFSAAIGAIGAIGVSTTISMLLRVVPASEFFLRTFSFTIASASFAAIVIWAYHQSWRPIERTAAASTIVWFSTRSYALYLCHGGVVRTMLHHGLFARSPTISALIFYGAAFMVAEAAHRLIERPAMRRRPQEIHSTGGKNHGNPNIAAQ